MINEDFSMNFEEFSICQCSPLKISSLTYALHGTLILIGFWGYQMKFDCVQTLKI